MCDGHYGAQMRAAMMAARIISFFNKLYTLKTCNRLFSKDFDEMTTGEVLTIASGTIGFATIAIVATGVGTAALPYFTAVGVAVGVGSAIYDSKIHKLPNGHYLRLRPVIK